MGQKIRFQLNKTPEQIQKETLGGDQAQLFMANEARRLMAPYVPELNSMMVKDVRTDVEDGKGYVHYLSPYSRYQYHGKLMVSSKTGSAWSHGEKKVITTVDLVYSKPMATSYWDKAAKTARGKDLEKAMQDYVKTKGG